ncbi:hypothetical protein JCM3774_004661 [Rhodotorula dairenensis]
MSAAQNELLGSSKEDVLAQSHSLLAVDVYKQFKVLDQSALTRAYYDAAEEDKDLLEEILAKLNALKLDIMTQIYTTEQSLQTVHNYDLATGLARVDMKQRTAHWIKEALRGLVQNLKGAFSTFFAGRAPLVEPALQVSEPVNGGADTAAAASYFSSSWLTGIVKPDADLDLGQVSQADAEGSTSDLDELEAILAQVDELFLHVTAEIYNAYARLSNLQGHRLAYVLSEITDRETEQERDRVAIVNFLELLRATLGDLQRPELATLD